MRSIEFLGIPGSGKSTLRTGLVSRLEAEGVRGRAFDDALSDALSKGIGDRLDPLMKLAAGAAPSRLSGSFFFRSRVAFKALAGFMERRPQAVSAVLDAQERRAEFEYRPDLVIEWYLHMVARYEVIQSTLDESTLVIMDEGFSQRAVSVFGHRFGEDDHQDLERYLAAVPAPELLIRLILDPRDAADRLQGDDRLATIRLEGQSVEAHTRFLEDADRCVSRVEQVARSLGWKVIDVDSQGSSKTSLDAITQMVVSSDP